MKPKEAFFGSLGLILASFFAGMTASLVVATFISLGSLSLRSQPGVEVIWDDMALGTTDRQGVLEIGGLSPGRYSLLLEKQGFESRSMTLRIDPGTQALNLPLTAVVEILPEPLSDPVSEATDTLPQPDSVTATSAWPSALAAMVIVLAGVTIFRLARRRPPLARHAPESAGPQVVMGNPGRQSNRSSTLLRDLKRREDSLDNFVEAGTGGLKRKVIEVESAGHGPADRQPLNNGPGDEQ